jgi:hypothetical protein
MDLSGGSITYPIIVSFITSSIISFAVFLVGLRAGKDSADRATIRDIYKAIYGHFASLSGSVELGSPKTWVDYPIQGNSRVPPIRALEKDGTINLLPKQLANRLLDEERHFLSAAYALSQLCTDSFKPRLVQIFEQRRAVDFPRSGGPSVEFPVMKFLTFPQKTAEALSRQFENNPKLGLSVSDKMGERYIQKYLFPESTAAISEIFGEIVAAMDSQPDLEAAATELLRQNDRIVVSQRLVSRRISDPHPIWSTLFRAVADLFKR